MPRLRSAAAPPLLRGLWAGGRPLNPSLREIVRDAVQELLDNAHAAAFGARALAASSSLVSDRLEDVVRPLSVLYGVI